MSGLLGLFGGTFNPVHNGHLFLALEAMQEGGLERVVFIPNRLPPHKEAGQVSAEDRYRMLAAAVQDVPEFSVSRVELEREGRSYTVDTLYSFPKEQRLAFICGADAFDAEWYQLDRVMKRLDVLLLANRAGFPHVLPSQIAALPEPLQARVRLVSFPDIAISSSDLRNRIAHHRPFRFLIPEPVYRIITESKLYGANLRK